MFVIKHREQITYALSLVSRLAHVLQSSHLDMSSPASRSLSFSSAELISALLEDGLEVRVRLTGWSMKPLVPSGSVLGFSAKGEPSIGDVVLARLKNNALVAHRVVALDSDRIWTKGDACRTADGPISRESVIARAVRLEGRISLPLSNVWMRALGLVVNRLYPRLVGGFRVLVPRTVRVESAS